MDKKICKIRTKDRCCCSGFFCKIPFHYKNNVLKVLITSYLTVDEKKLYKKDEEIIIYMKEGKKIILSLNNRIKYINNEYCTTIIEIKEEDGINDYNYLELDDEIINDVISNKNEFNVNKENEIYIIQYYEGELAASFGILDIIDPDKKYRFIHHSYIFLGTVGAPILYLNHKVLGVYGDFEGGGIFLSYPIKDFIKQNFYNDSLNTIKENNKIDNLYIKENDQITKYKRITELFGEEIYKKLDELYLYFSNKIKLKPFNFKNFYYHKNKYPTVFIFYGYCKNIIYQMEKCVCKIKIGNEEVMGFFCEIPFDDKNHNLHLLITNNLSLDKNIVNKTNIIISIGKKEEKYLNMNNRRKYSSKKYNTSIIEIKEEDEIKNYLNLDSNILIYNDNEYNQYFIDRPIYIIKNQMDIISISYNIITSIYEDKIYNFSYNCVTKSVQFGAPILTTKNKLIGIFNKTEDKSCIGTFLKYPIKEYIQENYNKK